MASAAAALCFSCCSLAAAAPAAPPAFLACLARECVWLGGWVGVLCGVVVVGLHFLQADERERGAVVASVCVSRQHNATL